MNDSIFFIENREGQTQVPQFSNAQNSVNLVLYVCWSFNYEVEIERHILNEA